MTVKQSRVLMRVRVCTMLLSTCARTCVHVTCGHVAIMHTRAAATADAQAPRAQCDPVPRRARPGARTGGSVPR